MVLIENSNSVDFGVLSGGACRSGRYDGLTKVQGLLKSANNDNCGVRFQARTCFLQDSSCL